VWRSVEPVPVCSEKVDQSCYTIRRATLDNLGVRNLQLTPLDFESGSNTIEGRVQQISKQIGAQLKTRFQEQGWISSAS
jgi:hypothetical protein